MKLWTKFAIAAAAVVNLLIVGYAFKRAFKPIAPIPIARDTTFIVGPRDAQGKVDYVAALNQRYGPQVAPADNALIPLWSIFGSKSMPSLPPDSYFRELGAAKPTAERSLFIEFGDLVDELAQDDEEREDRIYEEYDRATERPWTAKECPTAAEWLKRNEAALAKLGEVLRRSKFHRPLYRNTGKDEERTLLAAPEVELRWFSEAAWCLSCRAYLRAGEGKFSAAFDDLLACRKLARLASQGPLVADSSTGASLDATATRTERRILQHSRPPADDLRRYLAELGKLAAFADPTERLEHGERFIYLETILDLPEPGNWWSKVELSESVREGNRRFDRATAACRLHDVAARRRELKRLDEEVDAINRKYESRVKGDEDVLEHVEDEELPEYFVGLLFPDAADIYDEISVRQQQLELSQVAVALALHHRAEGKYPASLAALAPRFLPTIPNDRYADGALGYRLEAGDFVLYSFGRNGRDDRGENNLYEHDTKQEFDDLAVRSAAENE